MELTCVLSRRLASIVRQCFILRQNFRDWVTVSDPLRLFAIVYSMAL
jgi:hypothetical protein